MKIFLTRLLHALWYLFAASLVLAAVLVSIAHLLTPLLNKHRADFEVWASDLLQVPVTISEVHANWRGNIPELTLTHVVALDKETHKPAFDLQELKFGFQLFSSLWQRKIVLQDIIISGVEVTVLQDASGSFSIKDLPVRKEENYQSYQLTYILGWFFSQPYLALRDIDVHFLLSNGEKRELSIKKVSLVNQGDTHRVNGNFTLHQEIPTEVKARIEWVGRLSDPDHIKAQAYVNLEGVSLGQWLQGKNEGFNKLFSGWQIHQGIGGADLWLEWENKQLRQVQSVFQWYDLEFYSVQDKKTYPIEHLSGHVGWKREGEKQIFAGDNLLINFPNHLWPATTFYVVLAPEAVKAPEAADLETNKTATAVEPLKKTMDPKTKNKQAKKTSKKELVSTDLAHAYSVKLDESLAYAEEGVKKSFANDSAWVLRELRIGYLNLQDLLPILLANSSFPEAWHKQLLDLDPLGEVQDLAIVWQGDLTELTKTTISGEFNGLTFNPWQKFPGLSNLTGSLEWNGSKGKAHLDCKLLSLAMPSLFPEIFSFDQAGGLLTFQHEASEGWSFKTENADISNADLKLKAALQMAFPPQASPSIDLRAEFSLAKVTQLARYLPSQIMDPALVLWLKDAFLSGQLDEGKVLIQGKLNEFPFDPLVKKSEKNGPEGKFMVSGALKDVDFNYAPQWPIVQQANGRVIFSGHSMTAIIDSALILDVPVKQVSGVIPYLGGAQAQLVNVEAKLNTDLAKALAFIHQSPLEEVIGKDLASVQLKGPMNLDLSLSVPLSNPDKTKVLGKVQLTQAVLGLPDWNITMDHLHGAFQFTEQDLSAKQLQGMLWGEPTLLRLSTIQPSKSQASYIDAKLSGNINLPNLQSAMNLPLSFLSGTTAYQAQLKLYKSGTANNEVFLTSDLKGMVVDLPAPFGKPASLKRNFSLNFAIQQAPVFKAQLKYGDLIQAQLNIRQEKDSRVIDIDSAQIKGRVKVAYPFDTKRPFEAQLERLVINTGNAQTISSLDPRALPPLVINSKQFIYGNKNLGQFTLNTVPKMNGMTIQSFNLSAPDYSFQSKGQWVTLNGSQQSQLQGTIESSRVNKFLDRLGLSLRSLLVDKGRAAFDLQWKGAPYSFSLATTSGDFSFALERGRIINLNEADNNKMDMGRMLSLFSLQTIPRRLSLDFSDLFEKGYSFDFMRGDFSLKQGSAYTQKPAVFEGPVAHVTASGRIGLLRQDYDLILSISPYVTESLPVVAGALTLNPFVGAAAWVVNKMVLSKEVSKVITYNYKVTGSWNAPVWQSVQSKNKS